MTSRRRRSLGLWIAVVVAACAPAASTPPGGSSFASPRPSSSAATTVTPSGSPGASPSAAAPTPAAIGPWPTLQPGLVIDDHLACSPDPGAPAFTLTAFNAAVPVDMTSDSPPVRALRNAMSDGSQVVRGWRGVATTLSSVLLYIAPGDTPDTWTQAVLRAQPGPPEWRLVTVGECRIQVVPPEGISIAQLWLDANRQPTAADRTVRVLVVEMACASGQSAAGRIRAPQLMYRPEGVIVLVTVTRQPGGQDCQGNPPAPFDLSLAEPLGNRTLRNGAFLPPPSLEVWRGGL